MKPDYTLILGLKTGDTIGFQFFVIPCNWVSRLLFKILGYDIFCAGMTKEDMARKIKG